ncbi:MAG TPA: hypothetical protein VM869_07155 [Enhygromyxa sp.]|nr:hypothetical protein [Enhygromyxa sp.]
MSISLLASLFSFALLEPPAVEPVSLRWRSACVDREQALVRLRELIPELPEQVPEEAGEVAVEVEIEGTSASVRFVSARGLDERSLEGRSCESLAEAVILVIAVAVEAEVGEATPVETPAVEPEPIPESEPEPEPEPESEPEPEPELSATPVEPPSEPTPPRAKQRIRGHVALLGGGGWGPIDAGMGAVVLELGAHGPRWRASARGLWVPARTIALDDEPTLVGRYDGGAGGARACLVSSIPRAKLELPLCVGFEVGVLRGRGVDTTPDPDTATQAWAAVQLGPGLRYVPLRWLALGLDVDLVAGLLRGGFTLGDSIAQTQAPIGVRALAGLEVRFP